MANQKKQLIHENDGYIRSRIDELEQSLRDIVHPAGRQIEIREEIFALMHEQNRRLNANDEARNMLESLLEDLWATRPYVANE